MYKSKRRYSKSHDCKGRVLSIDAHSYNQPNRSKRYKVSKKLKNEYKMN